MKEHNQCVTREMDAVTLTTGQKNGFCFARVAGCFLKYVFPSLIPLFVLAWSVWLLGSAAWTEDINGWQERTTGQQLLGVMVLLLCLFYSGASLLGYALCERVRRESRDSNNWILFHAVCGAVGIVLLIVRVPILAQITTERVSHQLDGFLAYNGDPAKYWGKYAITMQVSHQRFDHVVSLETEWCGTGIVGMKGDQVVARVLRFPGRYGGGFMLNNTRVDKRVEDAPLKTPAEAFRTIRDHLTDQELRDLDDLTRLYLRIRWDEEDEAQNQWEPVLKKARRLRSSAYGLRAAYLKVIFEGRVPGSREGLLRPVVPRQSDK